jgi:nitroreductase
MDVFSAIQTRRTIHKYRATNVPIEAIERCIEAAHHAPNHKLTWPWTFVVAGVETRRTIFETALGMRRQMPGMSEEIEAKLRAKLLNPGGMVFVTQKKEEDAFRAKEDYAAISCAIQNFMLAAHALGYGTKWSTGAISRLPETYQAIGVEASTDEIVGLIWMGEAEIVPDIKRPNVEAHIKRLA